MSQTSDYGSDLDFDVAVVDGELTLLVPVVDATLPSSSAGGDFLPSSDDPSSDSVAPGLLPQEELSDDEKRAALRERCQDTSPLGVSRGDGPALARTILQKTVNRASRAGKMSTEGWCHLLGLAPTKEGGYVQLSSEGVNKFATLQEVLCWARGIARPVGSDESGQAQVSHLCDRPKCTVPSHVCVESGVSNNRRKGCLGHVPCVKTCSACHGRKSIVICRHDPPCVRYVAGYTSLEAWKANGICEDRSPEGERQARRAGTP